MAYYDTMEPYPALENVLIPSDLQTGVPIISSDYVLCAVRFTEPNWTSNTTTVALTAGAYPPGTGAAYAAASKTVVLVGTPTTNGLYSFTITVSNNGNSVAISFSNIKVTPTPQSSAGCLSSFVGVVGQQVYNPRLIYYGASPSVTWTGANLPPGLTVANISGTLPTQGCTGAIQGTPTAAGVFTFQITATGSLGDVTTVNAMLLITTFQNPAMLLPSMYVNVPYSFSFDQDCGDTLLLWTGGTTGAPYTWSFSFPQPTGLALSGAGVITGTPVASGINPATRAYNNMSVNIAKTGGGTGGGFFFAYVLPGSPPAAGGGIFGSFVGSFAAGHIGGGTK